MDLNCIPPFCIGNTPLREDEYLTELFGSPVLIKEEFNSPIGSSSKDRVAYYMIKEALLNGGLKKGDVVVEASSGNTGIGLATLSRELGLRCKIFVGLSCSNEKVAFLESLGAVVQRCQNSNGLNDYQSTQSCARRYAESHQNAYYMNQYENPANLKAHYQTTGPEIWEQSNGGVTHFIAGVGTGGTISGTAKYLKEKNPNVQIYGVEPHGSILSTYLKTGEVMSLADDYQSIDGIGRSFIPGNFQVEFIDEIIQVTRQKTIDRIFNYKRDTGLMCGFSSGAVLEASIQKILPLVKRGDKVVLLFPDHGTRYMSKFLKEYKKLDTLAELHNAETV
ncbi:MAG TPA: cysteine synthase family protein [Candidatus Sphingobacterium stercoripullorum]|nr:cysteine synthase family protein [Candidatus Sphingobacterium stercoripullorum]